MTTVLYHRGDVSSVTLGDDTYEPDEAGRFELPDHVAAVIHPVHVNGEKVWETHPEREARLEAERLAKRRDPAALLDAVEALTAPAPAAQSFTVDELRALLAAAEAAEGAPAEPEKPKPAPRKRTTKKSE